MLSKNQARTVIPDDGEDLAPRAWLSLALVAGVPLPQKLDWLREHDSPGEVLRRCRKGAATLAEQVDEDAVAKVLAWIAGSGGQCGFLGDSDYPVRLMQRLSEAPLALYSRGNLGLLDKPVVALVGGPQPTNSGQERARTIAYELAQEGVAVAAGVSPGIAQAAHQGAQSARGGAIGVVGAGTSWVTRLAVEIAEHGLVVSEHHPGQEPSGDEYVRRHRLLGALADVCVVVEAKRGCATVALAAEAGDMGCETAAFPAEPLGPGSGGNLLLRDGACLVETSGDILSLLQNVA